MRYLMLVLLCTVAFAGCKNPTQCEKNAGLVGGVIAMHLECKNGDAITAWLGGKFCPAPISLAADISKGPVATIACPLVVEGLAAFANGRVPDEWQCAKPMISSEVKTVITTACTAIIPL